MGFKKVYRSLLEIFPEVDYRLLRAVAIEHSRDASLAVEVVLTEVIPYLAAATGASSQSRTVELTPSCSSVSNTTEQTPSSSSGSRTTVESLEGEGATGTPCTEDTHLQTTTCPEEEQHGQFYDAESDHDQLFHDANGGVYQISGDSSTGKLMSIKNYDETTLTACANVSSTVPSGVLPLGNVAKADCQICGDTKSEDTITSDCYQKNSMEVVCNQQTQITSSSLGQDSSMDQSINNSLHVESINRECYQENNCADREVVQEENSLDHVTLSGFGTSKLSSSQCGSEPWDMPDILNSDSMRETNKSETNASKVESLNELVDVMDEYTFTTGVTPSAQACSIDLLEDIIADARNNKKTLFSAMDSVISLMKEVELQEKAAEQAKQEANEGSLETFKRVEEFKQMLQHAKEANDMHAGEVYGEKAILSTEVRELQSRLLSLSEERDKSLAILDEMHQSLEVRLAATEKEIEAAKREKLEKEEIGGKLLADQKKIMEKVVQEAYILKQEAEENAKLQEFLMDRGHVVDILQGEISVICQDVRLLKEKFDERLPLSKSLTSSQTSCILASSSSSLKSMAPEQVDPVSEPTDPSETAKKKDLVPSFIEPPTDQSVTAKKTDLMPSFIEPVSFRAEMGTNGHKASIEEGWEIFDDGDSYI